MSQPSIAIRLIESNNTSWRVREFNTTRTYMTSASASLICESPLMVRRLWRFPENWHSLSDSELLALFDIS
jgi:hypothetical protein